MPIIEFLTDWRAILQIVILFLLVYLAMYHLRNTHGSLVMGGLLMFIGSLWFLAQTLDLDVISRLLEMVLGSLFRGLGKSETGIEHDITGIHSGGDRFFSGFCQLCRHRLCYRDIVGAELR